MNIYSALFRPLINSIFSFIKMKSYRNPLINDLKNSLKKDKVHSSISDVVLLSINEVMRKSLLSKAAMKDLTEDLENRLEIHRWLLEDISEEEWSDKNLNLSPYIENYPKEADKMIAFFYDIFHCLKKHRKQSISLDTAQVIAHTEKVNENVLKQTQQSLLIKEQLGEFLEKQNNENLLSEEIMKLAGYEDIEQLLDEGEFESVRTITQERLRLPNLNESTKLKLNLLLINSLLQEMKDEQALEYLYVVLDLSRDEEFKSRIQSKISLIEKKLEDALFFARRAFSINKESKMNMQLLAEVYRLKGDYIAALNLLNENEGFFVDKALILLGLEKYQDVIDMANNEISKSADDVSVEALLVKSEAIFMRREKNFEEYPYHLYKQFYNDIEKDLEVIISKAISPSFILRAEQLLAITKFRNGKIKEAYLIYKNLSHQNSSSIQPSSDNILLCCLLLNYWEEAENILKERLEQKNYKLEDVLQLINIYLDLGELSKADHLSNKYAKEFENTNENLQYDFYCAQIKLLETSLENKNTLKFIEDLSISKLMQKALEGFYYLLKKEWNSVIEILEGTIDILNFSDIPKFNLIAAYFNRGERNDYHLVLKFIESIPDWESNKIWTEYYEESLYQLGEYKIIIEDYEAYGDDKELHKSKNSLKRIAISYAKLSWLEPAAFIFKRLYYTEKDMYALLEYCKCMYMLGKSREALQTMTKFQSEIEKRNEFEDYVLFSQAYESLTDYDQALHYAHLAFSGFREKEEAKGFYFSTFTQLSNLVKEMKDEWAKDFGELLNTLVSEEQDSSEHPLGFRSFQVGEDGVPSEILEMLKDQSTHSEQVTELYTSYPVSLNFLAQYTRHSLFEIWNQIKLSSNLMLWANNPLRKKTKNLDSRTPLLFDLGFLLVFQQLGKLDVLLEISNEFYFYQKHYTEILEEIKKAEKDKSLGKTTIGYYQGELIINQTPSSFFEGSLHELTVLKKWIDANCELIGDSFSDIFGREEKALGDYDFNLMNLAIENDYLLCCDSIIVFEIMVCKGHSINIGTSYNFLDFITEKGLIGIADFYQAYAKLQLLGYRTLPIQIDAIQFCLNQMNFEIKKETQALLSFFSQKELIFMYRFKSLVSILGYILNNANGETIKNKWINMFFDLILQSGEVDFEEFKHTLVELIRKMNIKEIDKLNFDHYLNDDH